MAIQRLFNSTVLTITLHKWTSADKEALIALCNAVDRTFLSDRLPYPYTEADADWWLGFVEDWFRKDFHLRYCVFGIKHYLCSTYLST